MFELPPFARVRRDLPPGLYPYLDLLPGVFESPALARITPDPARARRLVETARVRVKEARGFAYIDVDEPCIVLATSYLAKGQDSDLYLDLLHELTHLRQLEEGFCLWDDRFTYVNRPTEVEGYAVAIGEGRRLGMTEEDVVNHLSSPWLTEDEVAVLKAHVDRVLAGGELPNLEIARTPLPKVSFKPW